MPFPPLPPALSETLSARGFTEPTAVQAAVLQPEAVGRDLLVSAQTGSGKSESNAEMEQMPCYISATALR
jgi:ATP-dependent RNA helicase DeaD